MFKTSSVYGRFGSYKMAKMVTSGFLAMMFLQSVTQVNLCFVCFCFVFVFCFLLGNDKITALWKTDISPERYI